MATRRRSTRTRTTRRTRSTSRSTTRRRRPRLATTLGSAVAIALVAAWIRLSWWPWRIGIVAGVLVLFVVWFLWTRRGDIYDEMQARKDDEQDAQDRQG